MPKRIFEVLSVLCILIQVIPSLLHFFGFEKALNFFTFMVSIHFYLPLFIPVLGTLFALMSNRGFLKAFLIPINLIYLGYTILLYI